MNLQFLFQIIIINLNQNEIKKWITSAIDRKKYREKTKSSNKKEDKFNNNFENLKRMNLMEITMMTIK